MAIYQVPTHWWELHLTQVEVEASSKAEARRIAREWLGDRERRCHSDRLRQTDAADSGIEVRVSRQGPAEIID